MIVFVFAIFVFTMIVFVFVFVYLYLYLSLQIVSLLGGLLCRIATAIHPLSVLKTPPLLYSLFVPLEREILLEVGTLVAAHGNEFWQKYLLSDLLFAVLQASFHPLPHIQLSLGIGILCE